jgi:hypothetical protein
VIRAMVSSGVVDALPVVVAQREGQGLDGFIDRGGAKVGRLVHKRALAGRCEHAENMLAPAWQSTPTLRAQIEASRSKPRSIARPHQALRRHRWTPRFHIVLDRGIKLYSAVYCFMILYMDTACFVWLAEAL